MKIGEARAAIGAGPHGFPFGKTSKMPGFSYGLDAFSCKRGNRLAKDPSTPCHGCYARRNFYATWGPVILNRKRHQRAVEGDLAAWTVAMVTLLDRFVRPLIDRGDAGARYFRMHDSGDLVSAKHLEAIVMVARSVPWLHIWLPTHEPMMVAQYMRKAEAERHVFPSNFVIRLSADRNGELFAPPSPFGSVDVPRLLRQLPTSSTHPVVGEPVRPSGRDARKASIECLSHTRDHQCGSCRACWSPLVKNVSYPLSGGATAVSRARRATALRVIA